MLCYHSVSPTWPAPTSVTPAALDEQLGWLAGRGFRGATLADALTEPPAPRTLVVTFDDAHRSVLEHGLPILRAHGFVGTIFAPTDYVERQALMGWDGYDIWLGTEHEHELAPLSWDELGGLAESGWEIGAHTRTHPHLPEVDDEQLESELVESRRDCERRLGLPCRTLAYPYGQQDGRVRRAARDAGYMAAVTVPRVAAEPLPMAWPRVGVYYDDDLRKLRARIWRRSLPFRPGPVSRTIERLRGGGAR